MQVWALICIDAEKAVKMVCQTSEAQDRPLNSQPIPCAGARRAGPSKAHGH